jgi:hypothetical protein
VGWDVVRCVDVLRVCCYLNIVRGREGFFGGSVVRGSIGVRWIRIDEVTRIGGNLCLLKYKLMKQLRGGRFFITLPKDCSM